MSGGERPPLRRSDRVLLRYLYNDGSVRAALPLGVVVEEPEMLVGWLGLKTPIMYWSTADGGDPRMVPPAVPPAADYGSPELGGIGRLASDAW